MVQIFPSRLVFSCHNLALQVSSYQNGYLFMFNDVTNSSGYIVRYRQNDE